MFGFKSLFGIDTCPTLESSINPASGLPMIEGSSFDIAGNIYGTDYTSGGFDAPFGVDLGSGLGCGFED